jgi:hypothetical protein
MADVREWFVWNTSKGGVDTASIARTKKEKWCTAALLDEPYDTRVEWFNLDELEKRGRVETRGYVVLSPEQWAIERDALHERLLKTKAQQARLQSFPVDPLEIKYRSVLNLPGHGPLSKSEIEYAYRNAAKTSHPDVGGKDESFRRVSEAKDALLLRGCYDWPVFD